MGPGPGPLPAVSVSFPPFLPPPHMGQFVWIQTDELKILITLGFRIMNRSEDEIWTVTLINWLNIVRPGIKAPPPNTHLAGVDCGLPPTLERGRMYGTRTDYGSMYGYSCYWGYVFEGQVGTASIVTTCQEDGTWSHRVPPCIRELLLIDWLILLTYTGCTTC